MQRPSLGRIVLYQYDEKQVAPAIITRVSDKPESFDISLTYFASGLTYLSWDSPAATPVDSVRYSELGGKTTWRWPERV